MGMDEAKVRDLVNQLVQAIGTPDPPPNKIITVQAGQSIQTAINQAGPGTTLQIESGTYVENLSIGGKPITLQPAAKMLPGQASRSWTPVTIRGNAGASAITIANSGGSVGLVGLQVRHADPQATLIDDRGLGTILDRMVILGDPVKGAHRGVAANSSHALYTDSFIDDCGLVGRDAQGICGWDGTANLAIAGCFVGGGAQSIMFGGADAKSADRIPTGIRISGCVLRKNPVWYGLGWQIKNAFELKAAVDIQVTDTEMIYAGGVSGGQSAYAIVLTPRNQDKTAPWSAVRNVRLERIRVQYAGGGVLMLGQDDTPGVVSGTLDGVVIRNVAFLDVDAKSPIWTQPDGTAPHLGSGRVFLFNRGPRNVTIDGVTVTGVNLTSECYVIPPAPVGLSISNYVCPSTKYGWKIDAGAAGIAGLKALCPDAVITVTPSDTGATGYPRQGQ